MIEIVEADLNLPAHADAMVQLMDEYALDPMGSGKGLSDYVKANLTAELAKRKAANVKSLRSNSKFKIINSKLKRLMGACTHH
ncbi:hypothetical protein [Nostoc sp. CCY0012]|uniref:hypothetical protein n=1 Tax=Nostoc sp. CCY0012 TaxID=1056123 RepID=UPI0039C6B511